MNYKLIALDMDGTLLRKDKTVSERTKKAIEDARKKGVTVVLATGRPIDGVTKYLEELDMYGENDYVLSYNGGLVLKTKNREAICKIGLTGEDLHYLYEISKELGVNIHAFSETKGLITPKNSKYTEEEVLQKAIDNLPKEVYDKYTVVRSAPYFLEFLNKEVNKGVGVEMLAKHMGITLDQVITMGDAGNDLHMIECAGMGVAMGNAFEEIKEVANYITDTNENDGVAKAIEHLVLNS